MLWRMRRDSNPRWTWPPTTVFKTAAIALLPLIRIGRSGGDRTRGHLLPKQVRCHAALRSEKR